MKRFTLALAATAALTMGVGAASAQRWLPIVERQAVLDARIDSAFSAGALTRSQASMLRTDLDALVALEGRYRMNGLSRWERLDLDRRYGALDERVRLAVAAAGVGVDRFASVEDRRLRLERRIDQGLRSGQLTAAEADELREEFDAIARVEARYRIDGLSSWEVADLEDRLDYLEERIQDERTDSQRVYGWSRWF